MIDTTRPFLPLEHAHFDPEKMGKSTLYRSDQLLLGLNAFEPGQEHSLHAHEGMDKIYFVLLGKGELLLAAGAESLEEGMVAIAPSGMPHGIRNSGDDRLVVMAVLSPAP